MKKGDWTVCAAKQEEEEGEIERKLKCRIAVTHLRGEMQGRKDKRNEKAEVYEYIWSLANKWKWRGECYCVSYLLEDLL